MESSVMDKYCGSPFWDSALTWNTNNPDLTQCFENTVLVWIPCIFLWVFSIMEVYYITTSKDRNIPWNYFNGSKIFISVALTLMAFTDLIMAIVFSKEYDTKLYNVQIYTPFIQFLTFLLSVHLVIFDRKYGIRTSGILFLFWLIATICGLFRLTTEIRSAVKRAPDSYYFCITFVSQYILVLIMFFLNCFVDKPPRLSQYSKSAKPCPEAECSFLSQIIFSWLDKFTWKGYRKPLEFSDLWNLNHEDTSAAVVPEFDRYWQQTLKKCRDALSAPRTRATFKPDSARVDFIHNIKVPEASVMPALCKTFGPAFVFGAFLNLLQLLLTFVGPQILGLLIDFVEHHDYQWKGYLYVICLFVTAMVQSLIASQYSKKMCVIGMRIRTALIAIIYGKSLRLTSAARKESSTGEAVNLMAVDAQKFIELTEYLNLIWSAPLEIILALYFLWQILGPSVLAGVAVMIILIPVNGFIANRVKILQIKQMANKDERINLVNEVLSGIKVLKIYAWESSFADRILNIRKKETRVLKQAAHLNAGTSFLWACAPFLVIVVYYNLVYLYASIVFL